MLSTKLTKMNLVCGLIERLHTHTPTKTIKEKETINLEGNGVVHGTWARLERGKERRK